MIKRVKHLLKKYNLAPLHFLSQNFLISKITIRKMAGYAKKTTLEIGPGLGFLTEEISKNADRVIAVEKDRGMVELLNNEYDFKNVELYNEDFLETDLSFDCCVSSIPYSLSSKIILKLLRTEHEYSILLLQKEYAERVQEISTRLGVMVNALGDIEIIEPVDRKQFYPSPNVDSVIARLTPNKKVRSSFFSSAVRVLFQHRRKKVKNALIDSRHEVGLSKEEAKNTFSEIVHGQKRVLGLSLEEIEEISEELEEIFKSKNQENAV